MIGLKDSLGIQWNKKVLTRKEEKPHTNLKVRYLENYFFLLQLSNVKKGTSDLLYQSITFKNAIKKVGNCKDMCLNKNTQRYSPTFSLVFSSLFWETFVSTKNVMSLLICPDSL